MSGQAQDVKKSGLLPNAKKSIQQQITEKAPEGAFSSENQANPWAASSYWNRKSSGVVGDMINKLGGRGGFIGQGILMRAAGPEGTAAMVEASKKPKEQVINEAIKYAQGWGKELKKENLEEGVSHGFNPSVSFVQKVGKLYDRLDNTKLKNNSTAAVENEINADPELSKYFNDPVFKMNYPNIKFYLAQHYADLIKERDADYQKAMQQQTQQSNAQPVVTETQVITPTKKAVKIKVQKK